MSWSYRPALDGLRTVAVYSVLLFHTGHPWAEGGFIGVDLFFVLSGFLVTSVILSEVDRTGTLRVGHFWARRVRRLLPAAAVVVVATCAVFVLVFPVTQRVELVRDAQSALLYVANWNFLAQSGDYFAADADKSPFLHFWSLAIEEQYYVVFPLLLLLLSRRGRRWTVGVLTALFLASVAAQLWWAQVDAEHAYYGTDARLYQLLAGSLLALGLQRLSRWAPSLPWGRVAVAALVGFLLLSSGLLDLSPSVRGLGATVVSVALVAALMLAEDSRLGQVLSRRVPVFLGKVSYGTYLWHWPVILVLQEVLATSPRVVAVLTVAVSTGLAAASYEVVEMPIRRSKRLDTWSWTPALVGVAGSALLAVTLVPGLLELNRRPALTTSGPDRGAVTQRQVRLPADVDWQEVTGDYGDVGWCTAEDPSECTVVEGSGPHVLLLGDSQAQSLVPMFQTLAEEHDLTLSLNVVEGCLWQESLYNVKSSDEEQQNCEEARVGWYDEVLPRLDPDVVIIMARPRDNEKVWGRVVRRRDGVEQPLDRMTVQASRRTLQTITETVPRTLIVERLVMPETFDPADCLTTETDPGRCAVPVEIGGGSVTDGFARTEAALSAKVDPLDLNPAFCPDAPICLPVVGDEVVWRDDHHVTASFAVSRREAVWRILQRTGAFDPVDS